MPEPRKDGFFPAESLLVSRDREKSVYRIEFEDGYGTMTARSVMSGVTLVFNDFHTAGGFPAESRCPGLVEINHCRAGRFDCTMPDGRSVWLGPMDFAVSDMGRPPVESHFSRGLYIGISLVIEPAAAGRALSAMLGEGAPDTVELFSSLLSGQRFLVLRSESKIQHIFSELYNVPAGAERAYYKLKTAELLLFLRDRCGHMRRLALTYCEHSRRDRIREMGERLTENLQMRLSIADLAAEYGVSESTVKKLFRELYGEPPYSYLKRRRMEEAAFLLTSSEMSVTQIAEAVGYQNASKFSSAFRDIYSLTPSEYKRQAGLD